jgi:hypothetical protein
VRNLSVTSTCRLGKLQRRANIHRYANFTSIRLTPWQILIIIKSPNTLNILYLYELQSLSTFLPYIPGYVTISYIPYLWLWLYAGSSYLRHYPGCFSTVRSKICCCAFPLYITLFFWTCFPLPDFLRVFSTSAKARSSSLLLIADPFKTRGSKLQLSNTWPKHASNLESKGQVCSYNPSIVDSDTSDMLRGCLL